MYSKYSLIDFHCGKEKRYRLNLQRRRKTKYSVYQKSAKSIGYSMIYLGKHHHKNIVHRQTIHVLLPSPVAMVRKVREFIPKSKELWLKAYSIEKLLSLLSVFSTGNFGCAEPNCTRLIYFSIFSPCVEFFCEAFTCTCRDVEK